MTDLDKLPALPEPVLEGVDYELWGQNAKRDCYSKGQMQDYAITARADERARADALQAERDEWERRAKERASAYTALAHDAKDVRARADALEAALLHTVRMEELTDSDKAVIRALLEKT